MVSLRTFLSTTLVATLTLTSFLPLGLMAATPPTPVGFNTGGIFADYFKNAVTGNIVPLAPSTVDDCPADTYLYGFDPTPGSYMRKKCRSAVYIQAWNVGGNDVDNAKFLGTTNNQSLRFRTSNAERMVINPAGNVGINTPAPSAPLDVQNRIRFDYGPPIGGIGITAVGPLGGGWARQYGFTSQDGNTNLGGFGGLGTDNALSSWWIGRSFADPALSIDAATSNVFFTGSVGIGTTVPGAALHVSTPADEVGRFQSSGNPYLSLYRGGVLQSYLNQQGSSLILGNNQNGNINFYNNGAYNFNILANGNVGIGTAAPGTKLTLKQPGSGWDDGMSFVNPGGATIFKILSDNNAQFFTIAAGNDYAKSITLFANTGNVGIGTTAPNAKIQVEGGPAMIGGYSRTASFSANHPVIQFKGVSDTNHSAYIGYDAQAANEALRFWVGGIGNEVSTSTLAMSIRSTGNVGIGTTTPGEKLEINGNLKFSINNPAISSAGYITIPGGAHFSAGTVYIEAPLQARGGIHDDAHEVLSLNGGTSGNTRVTGDLSIGGAIRLNPATAQANRVLTALDNLGNAEWRAPAAAPAAFALTNDTWLQSTPDNANRLYYANGGGTLFGSPNGIYGWRNSTNALNNMILDDGGNLSINGNMTVPGTTRSRVFFDHDDTTYYVDPNGESRVRSIRSLVGDAAVSGPRWDTSFHVLEAGYWYAHNGAQTMYIGESNPVIVRGDIRSPIFYDLDNPAYNIDPNQASQVNTIYANNWFRAQGDTGLYFQDHGGGWNMTDNTWIRTFGNKSIYQNTGIMRTDGTFQVGGGGSTFNVVENGNLSYRTNVLFANTAGNVGIGTDTPGAKLEVAGQLKITGGVPGPGKILTSDATGLATWSAPASGMPAIGSSGQTLYSDGVSWLASSNIFNNNGDVGIGTNAPGAKLEVTSNIAEVANFSSTTPNAYINLYGAGTRKAYISATGSDLSIMNTQDGKLTLGTNGTKPFVISDGNVGIGVNIPTTALDIGGGLRLRQGAGDGKILISDANGNARWGTPGENGSSVSNDYGSLLAPKEIIPILGGNPMAYTDFMTYYSPLNISCPGGTFKLTISQREAADWPAVGTTYRFDGGVLYNQLNKDYEVYNSFGNRLHLNVGGHTSGGKAFIDGVSTVWWDGSPGQGGVQIEAACEGTCSAGYSGPLCNIPPCEDVVLAGGPACETSIAINPTNIKNRNLYRIGEYWGNVHFIMCDNASTNANRVTYADAAIGYMNSWGVPIPNVNFDMEYYGDHWLANAGTTTWQGGTCTVPDPDPGCTSGCGP